jgi:hypothetical protein
MSRFGGSGNLLGRFGMGASIGQKNDWRQGGHGDKTPPTAPRGNPGASKRLGHTSGVAPPKSGLAWSGQTLDLLDSGPTPFLTFPDINS